MVIEILLCSFLLEGILDRIHSKTDDNNHLDVFNCPQEEYFPDDLTDPNFINYPSYPGNPGNYSNQLSMLNYFQNLYQYSPSNKNGTCSITSIAQVLSYFDTFFNDNIIPDGYDAHSSLSSNDVNSASPGTLRDSLLTPFSTFSNHYLFANATYDECFDSKIMVDYNVNRGTNNSEYFSHSMTWKNKSTFINTFYSQYNLNTGIILGGDNCNVSNYTFSDDEVVALMDDEFDEDEFLEKAKLVSYEMFDDIVQYIDDGFPVMLSICQGFTQTIIEGHPHYNNYANHSVVAYDYEVIEDDIVLYCNFGYGSDKTHSRYDDCGFEIVYAYVPVYYTSPFYHHSDNYIINNLKFCGCGFHTHDITNAYVDRFKHSTSCPCGFLQHENHTDPFAFSCCTDNSMPPPGVM